MGLSASGKSTIADLLEQRLHSGGYTYTFGSDNVRSGVSRDLAFSDADRSENIRRLAVVARLALDAGLIVIVSFVSPLRSERAFDRSLFGHGEFTAV